MNGKATISISVIVPIYNSGKSIKKCLESICKQDFQNYEILCIDDESADDTVNIVKKMTLDNPQISLIQKKHSGQGDTRNQGICCAKGEYILFVDSDDVIAENMLSLLWEKAVKDSADLVISGFRLEKDGQFVCNYMVDDFLGTRYEFMNLKFKEAYSNFLINAPWNKLIRRKILIDNRLRFVEEMRIYEDVMFSLEVIEYSQKIAVVKQAPYTYFYMQKGSILSQFTDHADKYVYMIGDKLEKMMPAYDQDLSYYYSDLVHKMIVYASDIKRYKGLTFMRKLKKICLVLSNEKTRKYVKRIKTDDKKLKRQIFWIKNLQWFMRIVIVAVRDVN